MTQKISILILFLLLGSSLALQAQDDRVVISGTVLDSLKAPLTGATVILMHAQDSVMEGFAIADGDGFFRVETNKPDRYFLQITYVGYGTFMRELTISPGQEDIAYGEIVLSLNGYDLGEVTVEDSFIPIIIKKDTIIYNAAAFPTPEGAVVEDLLRRLPGVEVDQDGTIRAQGEEVGNIMVDGKPFFEDDPKIASQNIPADLVDRVQVFDQKSDFAEFTGIDDGQEEKTINLQIREGHNKGLFGTLNAGYGLEDRYKGHANVNRFTEDMQLSVLANTNNINEQAFSFEDYLQFMGGFEELMSGGSFDFSQFPSNLLDNSGVSDSYSGGVNFNYDFSPRTSLRSNYFANVSDNRTLADTYSEILLPESFFTIEGANEDQTQLGNHRLRFHLKQEIDEAQDIQLRANGSLFGNDNFNNGNSESGAGGILGNSSTGTYTGALSGWSWRSELTYRKKFNKPGRFLLFNSIVDGRDADQNVSLFNTNTIYPDEMTALIDSIRQQQLVYSNGWSLEGNLEYVEPLGESSYLKLGWQSNWVDNYREKTFSDWIGNGTYVRNEELSNAFDRHLLQNTFEAAFKMVKQKWNASIGLDAQQTILESIPIDGGSPLSSTFYSLLPNARLQYNVNSSSNLDLEYRTRIQAPSAEQLQPVIDNSDPLNIYIGNPELRPERISSFNVNYNSFSQFYLRSVFIGINGQVYQDRIIESSFVDDQLRRVRKPINSRDEWMINGFYDFLSPIMGVDLKVGLNGSVRYQRSNFLVNDALDFFNIWEVDQTFRLENKDKETWDLGIGYRFHFTRTAFREDADLNLPFNDQTIFTDLYWYAKGGWTINANVRYQMFSTARDREGPDFFYLDAGIQKSFFNKQLSFYIKGTNLLDQEVIFQRQSFGNQLSETLKNRFGRVLMVGAIYKIRSFGK